MLLCTKQNEGKAIVGALSPPTFNAKRAAGQEQESGRRHIDKKKNIESKARKGKVRL